MLPFANLSDDKANEYFSDGISEELLNVLAKIPGLKVSARTSAFYFKGKEVPVPEIAKQLGLSESTIAFHRGNIRTKLGVDSERGLIRYALLTQLDADFGRTGISPRGRTRGS